jgi:hypothetical protein
MIRLPSTRTKSEHHPAGGAIVTGVLCGENEGYDLAFQCCAVPELEAHRLRAEDARSLACRDLLHATYGTIRRVGLAYQGSAHDSEEIVR